MNTKTKLSIISILTLLGIFAFGNITSAQTVVPSYNSATITGTVITGTPPTHARFSYSTSYSAVASGQGITTPVQYFYTEGTFPIQQYISGLTEDTTYFYRLEVTNNYGTQNLNIESFKTSARPVTTYTVGTSYGQGGYISPTSRTVNSGETATFTVTPNQGYTISSVTGCNGYLAQNTYTTGAIYSNCTVYATFNVIPVSTYTVSTNAGQGGYISPTSRTVNSGSTTTFTITPNQGYTISSVTGCNGNLSQNIYTTGAIYSDCTVTATFNVIQSQNPTVFLTVDGKKSTTINSGQSATLSWNTNSATSYCSANWMYNSATTGSQVVSPTSSTTYNITCYGASGTTPATDSVTVTIASQPQPTLTFSAYPTTIESGGRSQLTWNSTNATSCIASGGTNGWYGGLGLSANQSTGVLYSTTTFTITCSGSGGNITRSVTVNVNSQPNMTGSISANPSSCIISSGNSTCNVNLIWDTTNPTGTSAVTSSYPNFNTTVFIGNSGYNKQVSIPFGYRTFYLNNMGTALAETTVYASCAANTQWDNSKCATIIVPPQNATGTLNVSPSSCIIASGQSTCTSSATWSTNNTTDPKLVDRNTGYTLSTSANSPYSFTVWATYPQTTYDLKNGFNNLDTKTVTASCASGTSWDNYKCATTIVPPPQPQNPTVNLTADQTSVNYNNGTYLRWTSQNATSCTASGGTGNWSGTKNIQDFFYTGMLTSTTTYYINCTNSIGQSQNSSITIYVNNSNNNNQTPTVTTNSPSSIGINYATLNGYVNSNGGSNVNAWFEWGSNSYYGNQTNQISYGSTGGTSYSYNLSGLAQNTTYYYRAVAQNTNGQIVYGNQMSFSTSGGNNYDCTYYGTCYINQQPLVTTYSASNISNNVATLNAYIDSRNSSATRWFEYGPNYNSLYSSTNRSSMGSYSGNFSESIYNLAPNTTYYFRAAAQGNNGSIVYGNVLNFNTGTGDIYNACVNGICTPTAVTNIATNIGSTSARLNGVAIVNNAVYTTGYFEYGTTQNLGSTTPNKNTGSTQSSPFYDSLFNLASNTTYYYRAVVANQYGTARGDILSFRTGNYITYTDTTNTNTTNTNTTRTIYRNTTVVSNTNDTAGTSRPSLVFLSISRNGEVIRKGSLVEYVVNYKNVSVKNLRDLVLQVYIPKELEFVEASRGTFSTENNTVVANIGNLNSQEEGSTRITVRVTTNAEIGKIVVVTANLAYTIVDTNVQEEVFAYTKNSVETENVIIQQGALAFLFGGSFFPTTLLGWLLLILLIVLLILAVRKAYYSRGVVVVADNSKTEHH